jgi:hypothetical protein
VERRFQAESTKRPGTWSVTLRDYGRVIASKAGNQHFDEWTFRPNELFSERAAIRPDRLCAFHRNPTCDSIRQP